MHGYANWRYFENVGVVYDFLRRFIGKTKKILEGDTGVDLAFQFRIGVDVKPLLEQEEFHEEQGHICLVATEEGGCCTAADVLCAQQR